MAKKNQILKTSDREFIAPDRMNFLVVLYSNKIPKADLKKLYFDPRGEARPKLSSGLTLLIRRNRDSKGRMLYHATYLVKGFNGQETARALLRSKGVKEIRGQVDPIGKKNFVCVEARVRQPKAVATVMQEDLYDELWKRLEALRRKLIVELRQTLPLTRFQLQCYSLISAEVACDLVKPVGTNYGVDRDMDFAISPLIKKKFRAYYTCPTREKIPTRRTLPFKTLRRSSVVPGWPSYHGNLYDGCDLEIYVKQATATAGWLQRIEYKFPSKEVLDGIFKYHSFSTERDMKSYFDQLNEYVWQKLYRALGINCFTVRKADIEKAKMLIRHFHPKHSDLVSKALFQGARSVSKKLWFVSEDYIKSAKDAGVLLKAGPETRSSDYTFNFDCLSKYKVRIVSKGGKTRGKKALDVQLKPPVSLTLVPATSELGSSSVVPPNEIEVPASDSAVSGEKK